VIAETEFCFVEQPFPLSLGEGGATAREA